MHGPKALEEDRPQSDEDFDTFILVRNIYNDKARKSWEICSLLTKALTKM